MIEIPRNLRGCCNFVWPSQIEISLKPRIRIAIALLTATSFAQNTSTTTTPANEGTASQGIRLSVFKPMLEMKTTYSDLNIFNNSQRLDNTYGIAFGYAKLPVQEIGFTANIAFIGSNPVFAATFGRIDGNIGYAFNKHINLKGGLNTMKFIGRSEIESKPGLGYQAGLGFQISKNAGLDIGYSEMNFSDKSPITIFDQKLGTINSDVKLTGLEVGLNATF